MQPVILLILITLLHACKKKEATNDLVNDQTIQTEIAEELESQDYQAISLLGDTLIPAEPSEKLLNQLKEKREAFQQDPMNLENIIWFGRFTAYSGQYREAINIYSEGLQQFPDESRLLRHRGHRWITLREFDKAIADLGRAAELIKGKENMVEQDGMPNELGIPVSSMHGNIYYHLGLAYYLNGEYEQSLMAYQKCLETSPNPDNVVSATHWIYMNLQLLGRPDEANEALNRISPDMKIIENQAYFTACLFYQGELKLQDIYDPQQEASPSGSALLYGIGNWYMYNGMNQEGRRIFEEMVSRPDWASFGHIAAEADLARQNFNPGNGGRM
ncbi:hypothetical protein BST85_07560 [Aureitalea marina]|uniref:Uncharacterized protein n=1 Tax=Aureitalea marina TaxID=930804 RepID=A0A2S7KTQ9_9FLAO|nr:hypothetical protein BST85_07560 [Aureitalea marina]